MYFVWQFNLANKNWNQRSSESLQKYMVLIGHELGYGKL